MAYTTINDGSAYYQTHNYTGNGADNNAQTLTGNSNMQPDFVWIKSKTQSGYNHCAIDSVRGVTKFLRPNL